MDRRSDWMRSPQFWLEVFVLANLAGLALDIYLAHSTNLFADTTEYIPLVFSLVSPPILAVAIYGYLTSRNDLWRWLGHGVGWTAVALGVTGLILHLESHFFHSLTIKSLVYTAPFAAPLSYTGIGLLLIMNRMVRPDTPPWPQWVLLLALGGFVGNFVFSLADHAQDGFFHVEEWIPVVASAVACGFLVVVFLVNINRTYLVWCAAVMFLQMGVGLLGFYYHNAANLHGSSTSMFENLVYGAPPMAPLLFPNLALLSLLGLYVLRSYVGSSSGSATVTSTNP